MHSVCSAIRGRKEKGWGEEKRREREKGERRTQMQTQGQETTDASECSLNHVPKEHSPTDTSVLHSKAPGSHGMCLCALSPSLCCVL